MHQKDYHVEQKYIFDTKTFTSFNEETSKLETITIFVSVLLKNYSW